MYIPVNTFPRQRLDFLTPNCAPVSAIRVASRLKRSRICYSLRRNFGEHERAVDGISYGTRALNG